MSEVIICKACTVCSTFFVIPTEVGPIIQCVNCNHRILASTVDNTWSNPEGSVAHQWEREVPKIDGTAVPVDSSKFVLSFGKFKGSSLGEIAEKENGLDYLDWMSEQPWIKDRQGLSEALEGFLEILE